MFIIKNKKIIVIIPAYNEEESVEKVVSGCKVYVDEVIVIDDGSRDRTAEFAKRAGATVVSNVINRGLGVTVRRGYQEALRRGADIVVQIDADGQYTIEDIPKLIKPILDNKADMVLASRFKGGIEKMPLSKVIGNKIATLVTRLVSGYPVSDAQTGFRAIRKELLEEIQPTDKYTYVQEMIIRAAKEGWRIMEIPSYFKKRESGSSRLISNIFSYAKRGILILMRAIRDYHPLAFFGIPGVILFLIGALIGLNVTLVYLSTKDISMRVGSVVLSSFLMISGLVLFFIGLLADMIEFKYKQLREEIRILKK